jgi:hypothetical protein
VADTQASNFGPTKPHICLAENDVSVLAEFVGEGVDLLGGQDALPGWRAGREVDTPGDVVREPAGKDAVLENEAQDSGIRG